MAINKNHLFEDLDGIKCAVVESGIKEQRTAFLKSLLELNGYTVVIVPEAPAKSPAPPPPAVDPLTDPETNPGPAVIAPPPPPQTFKLGVTDVVFNATNAIYGRLLKSKEGHVVTMAYWLQKEAVSNDEIPYFDRKIS
ncbi:MAG: hypothetical protein M3Q95_02880 [Bacteroidota bacterium]|nr:hypothetical protein [Bacteroidota bacterium]